jgi:hypothetical protein
MGWGSSLNLRELRAFAARISEGRHVALDRDDRRALGIRDADVGELRVAVDTNGVLAAAVQNLSARCLAG